eukprot:405886-Prorocentrum_minimum.AAC.1
MDKSRRSTVKTESEFSRLGRKAACREGSGGGQEGVRRGSDLLLCRLLVDFLPSIGGVPPLGVAVQRVMPSMEMPPPQQLHR